MELYLDSGTCLRVVVSHSFTFIIVKRHCQVAELVTSPATVSASQIAHARKRFTPLPSKACNMARHDAIIKPVWRGKIICLDWESERQTVIHMTRIYT